MLKIGIIHGSTRPGRVGEAVAEWACESAQKHSAAEFEVVDIKVFNLPLLDEPIPPFRGQYSKPHTKAWVTYYQKYEQPQKRGTSHLAAPDEYIYKSPQFGRNSERIDAK